MLLIASRLAGCSRKAREYWGRDTLPILGAVLTFSCALLLLFYASSANAAERQLLGGHVPRAVANLHLQPVSRLAGSTNLYLSFSLPLRNTGELTNLLHELYDPASSQYHRYLTPEQFAERFGPAEQDYSAVIAFAKANGLAVTRTHPNRTLVGVTGSVTDIEKLLHVTMRVYQHPTEARTFYAPDVEPSVDLAVTVLVISGLDNFTLSRPAGGAAPFGKAAGGVPASGSGLWGSYIGNDFRAAYIPGVSLTGSGQAVGLFELDGYYANDITAYESQAGLPNVTLTNVLVDGFNGSAGANNLEAALDIDMAIAMAPGLAKVIVYESTNFSAAVNNDLLNKMATDNSAKQLSCSWLISHNAATDQIYPQFAAQGQSFFQCSGDDGAYNWSLARQQRADSPYATIVGGTVLTMNDSGASWASETTWADSGGGISTNYAIPPWQQGVNMSANQGSTILRNVPDVSMVAMNLFLIWNNGFQGTAWGTSASTPLWAGLTALVNQRAASSGLPSIGFINPAVYLIGMGASYSNSFHDIATGSNTWFSSPNAFSATNGYDLCTGWGSPAGSNIINALLTAVPTQPASLQVTPVSLCEIDLSWANCNCSDQSGFVIQRSLNGTSFSLIATVASNVSFFADTGLDPGTTYYYSVEATNAPGIHNPARAWATTVTPTNWVSTGSLNAARWYHTATVLSNSLVLVAAGYNGINYLSGAELYNPASGTWRNTASLSTGRYYHTATLLSNGLVLVAGGYGSSGNLSSAELYNPASGTWTNIASLSAPRWHHTATLLPNGKVLVAGGVNSTNGYLASVELYNPASGTWTNAGSLNAARADHTATLLPNGLVLVAGGYSSTNGYLASVELYNPASGTWTNTGPLSTGRDNHTATLLPNGLILVAGGSSLKSGYVASAELYNPAGGTWTNTGSLNIARYSHTATLLPNGLVLVAGGEHFGGALSSAELYDPASGMWKVNGSLSTARYGHTATLLPGGLALFAGGFNYTNYYLASAELYNPASGVCPPVASFSATPISGASPLSVSFTDTSSGSVTGWAWAFGDGNTSLGQDPSHLYVNPGTYNVQEIVSGPSGSSTNTKPNLINVYNPFAWWQLNYFGSTNNPNAAPVRDYTGTGMSNTNKFLSGFNPTNPAAYLRVTRVAEQSVAGHTNVIVTYLGPNGDNTYTPGIASRTNVLDYTTGDTSGNYTGGWQNTGQTNILSGGNGSGIVTNMVDTAIPAPSTNRYYRVRVLLP